MTLIFISILGVFSGALLKIYFQTNWGLLLVFISALLLITSLFLLALKKFESPKALLVIVYASFAAGLTAAFLKIIL